MDAIEAVGDGAAAGLSVQAPINEDGSPDQEARGAVLRVYARCQDSQIKIISDGKPVPEAARLADAAFFVDQESAWAIAKYCAQLLARSGMPADKEGWHPLPVLHLPALLNVARNQMNVTFEPGPIEAPPTALSAPPAPVVRVETSHQRWTGERIARLGWLACAGYTAKQIAEDPLIRSTPNAVQRQANRLGIMLSDGPHGQVAVQLPIATTVVIDRAASVVGMTRKAFVRQWLIRGALDPARYGMVVVSA